MHVHEYQEKNILEFIVIYSLKTYTSDFHTHVMLHNSSINSASLLKAVALWHLSGFLVYENFTGPHLQENLIWHLLCRI